MAWESSSCSSWNRKCLPEIQNEVDDLIIDYLAYNAIKTIEHTIFPTPADGKMLSHEAIRKKAPQEVEDAVYMINSYLIPLQEASAPFHMGQSVKFRLRLLKFLMTFRFQPENEQDPLYLAELYNLRDENSQRIETWYSNANVDVLPVDIMHWYSNFTSQLAESDLKHSSPQSLTLQDQLPSFIGLLALRSDLGRWPVSGRYFQLAGKFMLQSVLQQYTRIGSSGTGPIARAFAWGFDGLAVEDSEGESPLASYEQVKILRIPDQAHTVTLSNDILNSIFCTLEPIIPRESAHLSDPTTATDSDFAVAPSSSWQEIRNAFVSCLLPVSKDDRELEYPDRKGNFYDTMNHLYNLCWENPIDEFMKEVMSVLSALNESIPRPILTQLEAAQANEAFKSTTKLEIADGLESIEVPWEEAEGLCSLVQGLTR